MRDIGNHMSRFQDRLLFGRTFSGIQDRIEGHAGQEESQLSQVRLD